MRLLLTIFTLTLMAFAKPNHLVNESSPYLKLHANQPVDWYPWGEEAFAKAVKEDKPILLSVGYSTCHWCHVMARESFENEEIAAYLNEHFVAIKLDREERPDIDHIYMTAHQAMNEGSGGWPLNVFLTPEKKPFFGGTYYPPKAKANRPGFDELLKGVQEAWTEKREQITNFSENITKHLQAAPAGEGASSDLGKNFIAHTMGVIRERGDNEFYGWGRGPKFPQTSFLRLLLLSSEAEERKFALDSLNFMGRSGLYDHLNGGFHRYCVDQEWVVPHFEKMLYDQAQLIETYLDAYLLTKDPFHQRIATETCEYLLREMRAENGVFYAAQDAQSENKEGKFSCWTLAELKEIFDSEELELLQQHFTLTEEGNFYDFSDPEALKNQNVLVVQKTLEDFNPSEQKQLLELRKTLFEIRAKRVPPATDSKILLNWNALAISALARASFVLETPKYLEAAREAYDQLLDSHVNDGDLYHSAKDEQRHGENLGADYASMIYAARTLYHSTLDSKYLTQALDYSRRSLNLFFDKEEGGFYEVGSDSDLVMRLKSEFDNALPSVASQMVRELSALTSIADFPEGEQALEKTLTYYQATLQTAPFNLGEMILSIAQLETQKTLALSVQSADQDTLTPYLTVGNQSLPAPMILGVSEPVKEFYQTLPKSEKGVTAYLCEGNTCKAPTSDLEILKKQLK